MSQAFNLAINHWEWVKENPVKKVSKEKINYLIERWLTLEAEQKLLASSPGWLIVDEKRTRRKRSCPKPRLHPFFPATGLGLLLAGQLHPPDVVDYLLAVFHMKPLDDLAHVVLDGTLG